MNVPYVNIHTHRRTGVGIEVVSVMAGRGAREAARAAIDTVAAGNGDSAGTMGAEGLSGTANVESDLPEAPFSIGIHPWQIAALREAEFAEAMHEVEAAPAWGIGEIGLDYAIETDRERQAEIFAAQLRIAEARKLPVVLHCVRAFEQVCEILAGYALPAVIFHGFVGSPEQAARAVGNGYYLSFGKRSLGSPKTVEALRITPLERLFLETDDAPLSITEIYSRACEVLDVPVETLVQTIYENYERLVGTY